MIASFTNVQRLGNFSIFDFRFLICGFAVVSLPARAAVSRRELKSQIENQESQIPESLMVFF
jgi:hypothetical protein